MSNGKTQVGFTIIETMLFLGVTGLIMSFMLVGVSTQLNQRRYQDASTSLITYMQNQYNLVSNVNNSRPDSEQCTAGQIQPTGGTQSVGMSDCTIVGRLLRSTDAGKKITSVAVVATRDAALLPLVRGDTDVKVLRDALLTTGLSPESYEPQWSTTIVQPAPNNDQPSTFSILIVRMPTSGVIHTFVSQDEAASFNDLLNDANVVDFRLCLESTGLLGVSSIPVGVKVNADASNTSGIEFVSQGGC